MVIGIGVDIISKKRIVNVIDRQGVKFLHRILHEDEILTSKSMPQSVMNAFVAKRFCAKEAIVKAIGCGLYGGLHLTQINITKNNAGSPLVPINPYIQKAIIAFNPVFKHTSNHSSEGNPSNPTSETATIRLSISDDEDNIIAFAILEA